MPVLTLWGGDDLPDGPRANMFSWVFPRQSKVVFENAGKSTKNPPVNKPLPSHFTTEELNSPPKVVFEGAGAKTKTAH
eukprot:1177647-Prorocentrum_minimum.AAC.1